MKIIVLLFGFIFMNNVCADVEFVSEQGFIVKNKIETKVDKKRVWQALIIDVDQWWPKDHSWWGKYGRFSIESKAGGCFCESAGEKSAEHMRISFVEPQKLLRMTGGLGPLQGMGMYGSLDWKFSSEDGMTQITLTYSVQGFNADGFNTLAPIVSKVQGQQLRALKSFVENLPAD